MTFKRTKGRSRAQLFLNFKGGTGKTTLSVAYGLQLAEMGHRVLFVDLDAQGHMTKCLGANEWQFDRTLYHALIENTPLSKIMLNLPGLAASLIPADISVSTIDLSLGAMPYREWRLIHALAPLKERFDVVVFDASPAISLLNLNAILACKDLIIPILPDSLSLFGLKSLMKTLASIETDFDHQIENVAILVNRFLQEDEHCVKLYGHLKKAYGARLLKTTIRHCPDLGRQPLLARFGARLSLEGEALEDVRALAREIAPSKRKSRNRKESGR